jgi:Tfp pilus assembly protein PilN
MIELFDAERLLPRRDLSLPALGLALLVAAAGMAAWGMSLQRRLDAVDRQRLALEQRLQSMSRETAPSPTLLAELQRDAERLEAEASADPFSGQATGPRPSQWMARLAELGGSELALTRLEVDRAGSLRIEGQARSPQAVSTFVQAFEQQQRQEAPMRPRAVELKQDAQLAPLLRFQLRATPPPLPTPRTTPAPATPAATPVAPAQASARAPGSNS